MASRGELLYPEDDRLFLESYLPATNRRSTDSAVPFVTLTFATSLDSALSLAPGVQTALSGPQSKAMTHYLRCRHDAIMVGVGTAIADNPSLNCRIQGVGGYGGEGLTGQPRPVVIDPQGRWQLTSETKILNLARQGRGKAPWIVTAKTPGAENAKLLEEVGGCYIVLKSQAQTSEGKTSIAWLDILRTIKERGIESIMIEGGAVIINSLLSTGNADLINSVIVTIAPTWLGRGGVVVSPPRSEGSSLPVARLQRTKWQQLGDDVVLCGTLKTASQTSHSASSAHRHHINVTELLSNNLAMEKMDKSKTAGKIHRWGTGLFENDSDSLIIHDLTEESGVQTKTTSSFLYLGDVKAHILRKHLDAGALDKMLKKRLPIDRATVLDGQDAKDTMWYWPINRCPGYKLCLLGAIMMQLGCKIRPDFRQSLEDLHDKVGLSRNAQVQLRHALNVYVDGIPYDFRWKRRPIGLENDDFAADPIWGDISKVLVQAGEDSDPAMRLMSRQIFGPMLKCTFAGDTEHPQNACGNCGRKKAPNGSPCRPCSLCGQRRYCSRKCELAHRPKHQLICDDPDYRKMGNVWANSGDRVDADAAKKLSRVTELDNQTTESDDEDGTSSAESASASDSAGSSDDDLDAMPACGNCDNFSITMPDQLKTKIVLAHHNSTWWCIVYGNESKSIWKTGKGCDTPELALRKMLVSSSDMVFDKFQKEGFGLDA
ncbi:riboflavin-specific deaminase, partial [Aureobasidium melanogenum]